MSVVTDIVTNKLEVLLLDENGFHQPYTSEFYQELLLLKSMEYKIYNYVKTCPNKDKNNIICDDDICWDHCCFTYFCDAFTGRVRNV